MYFNNWLHRRNRYTPDRVAIVDDSTGRHHTYAELEIRATRLAAVLQKQYSVRPGDRVACLATNRIEYFDLYFACGKIGAILVPLNFRLPALGIYELLDDSQPSLFVYEAAFAEIAQGVRDRAATTRLLPLDQEDAGSQSAVAMLVNSDAVDADQPELFEADENDVAMILYTSGTTGRAKGAMIPWRQIHWNALNTIIGLQLTQDDVAFLNTPLYHTGGWHVLFTPLMLVGGQIVLQERFDPEACNARVGSAGITILFGIPTMLRMMAEASNFSTADFSAVRFAICGGEPCPLPLIRTYEERGVAVRQGYGLTEAGPNCYSLPAADAIRKQGSIGFPNFHIAARLVDESGRDVEAGEVGELLMKGPHLFAGYWGNADETNNTLRNGWLHTGDLLSRDEEGYYFVVSRKKDMYISGGENVYPAQVEKVLQSHDAVAQAAIIGVPDARWGETGWAFVKLQAGQEASESELVDWCQQRLAKYQCPTKIVLMDELPLGPSAKIDKPALRELAARRLESP